MARHVPPLHVDIAGASDPIGGRHPSMSKSPAANAVASVPTNKSFPPCLNLPEDQEMDMTYPHISVGREVMQNIVVCVHSFPD